MGSNSIITSSVCLATFLNFLPMQSFSKDKVTVLMRMIHPFSQPIEIKFSSINVFDCQHPFIFPFNSKYSFLLMLQHKPILILWHNYSCIYPLCMCELRAILCMCTYVYFECFVCCALQTGSLSIISQKSHRKFFLFGSKTSQKLWRSQITQEGEIRGGHCRYQKHFSFACLHVYFERLKIANSSTLFHESFATLTAISHIKEMTQKGREGD